MSHNTGCIGTKAAVTGVMEGVPQGSRRMAACAGQGAQ